MGRGTFTGEVGLIGAENHGDIDTEGAKVGHPKEGDPFVTVVIGVDKEYYITLPDLLTKRRAVLWACRGVDDSGCDIFGSSNARRDRNLGEDGLDLVVDKLILDERSDEARFAGAFITADTNPYYTRAD